MSVLDNQSKLNPTTAFYAPVGGGGGGGGAGPNPVVSTITLNGTGGVATPNVLFAGDNAVIACQNVIQFTDSPYSNSEIDISPQDPPSISVINAANQFGITIGTTSDGYGYISAGSGGLGISLENISSINGAPPGGGGGGGGVTVSTFTDLTVSSSVTLGGILQIRGSDTNLYDFNVIDSNASNVAGFSLGQVAGRNQLYADLGEINSMRCSTLFGATGVINFNPSGTEQIRIGGLGAPGDITINTVGGGNIILNGPVQATTTVQATAQTVTISSLVVSSINGAAPGGSSLTNNSYPFTTGSDNSGTWQLTVASNTGGSPQFLTNSVTTNSSNSYLVTVALTSGSNTDTTTTSITKLALALSGGNDVTLGSFPGFADYWIYNGTVGTKTAIVRGASAIRLYAWVTSPTNSTDLFFDTATGMSITNLGPSA